MKCSIPVLLGFWFADRITAIVIGDDAAALHDLLQPPAGAMQTDLDSSGPRGTRQHASFN
jgi:hypothetical protein